MPAPSLWYRRPAPGRWSATLVSAIGAFLLVLLTLPIAWQSGIHLLELGLRGMAFIALTALGVTAIAGWGREHQQDKQKAAWGRLISDWVVGLALVSVAIWLYLGFLS